MTEKDMKKLLKNAYQISPSDREKAFLQKYEKRSMHILDVFILEFKYMGLQSVLSGAILIILFGIISFSKNSELMWYVSGILPVVGLILISGIGKSEKYGMHELEATSRFSLQFIKATRMFLLGSATLSIVVVISILLQEKTNFAFMSILGFIGTPYMLNAWGNIVITRRWHDKESIFGCTAVTGVTCMIPALMKHAIELHMIEPFVIVILMVIISALTVRESLLFIKGREDLSWNFC